MPSPVLWGILTALLRFVPYIGSFIAALLPIGLAAAVDPGWSMMLWTAALFIVSEPFMGHVVEPLVYGKSTGNTPDGLYVYDADERLGGVDDRVVGEPGDLPPAASSPATRSPGWRRPRSPRPGRTGAP